MFSNINIHAILQTKKNILFRTSLFINYFNRLQDYPVLRFFQLTLMMLLKKCIPIYGIPDNQENNKPPRGKLASQDTSLWCCV